MEKTTYQQPELRNAQDQVVQSGAYGKNTALCNTQNTGAFDYINNNLQYLYDTQGTTTTDLTQAKADITQAKADIVSLQSGKANKATTLAGYGITDAYTKSTVDAQGDRITANEGDIDTLQAQMAGTSDSALKEQIAQKAPLASPALTGDATLDGEDILAADDVLTLDEIEASTELADTDVASASSVKELASVPERIAVVVSSGSNVTISNLSKYRYLLILGATTNNTYVMCQKLIPIAFAKQYASIHRCWLANAYDGTRYFTNVDVQDINSNIINVSFVNLSGVYVYGVV